MRDSRWFVVSIVLLAGTPAFADDSLCSQLNNLVSRPTVSTTACAVGDGSYMIESGFTNQSSPGRSGDQTLLFPQTTVRDGLGRGLEFLLTPPSYERISSRPAASGDLDGAIGAKYQFASTSRFASAVGASYSLGTGTPGLETTGEGLDLALDTNLTITPALSLSSTLAYVSNAAGAAQPGAGRLNAFEPSLALSVSLPANLTLFGEGFGKSSGTPGGAGQYGLDGGITYDLGKRLQLDANAFDTIGTSGGRSHSLGFGAAYLFGRAP